MHQSRRVFGVSGLLLLAQAWVPASRARPAADRCPDRAAAIRQLARLEFASGGRLGVAVREIGSGRQLDYRATRRFPMCSTHKLMTVAAILSRVEQGRLRLDQPVGFGPADMLDYAPVCRARLATGVLSVAELCAAALQWSDNVAANLLLGLIGGPAGWTAYLRTLGDNTSRLDRLEPALNRIDPAGRMDSTTPAAMRDSLSAVLCGPALAPGSRRQLRAWLLGGRVTGALLRAGLPSDWQVADKSGSGPGGTRNDIGLLLPPAGRPLLVTVYSSGSAAGADRQNRLIADVAGVILRSFGGAA